MKKLLLILLLFLSACTRENNVFSNFKTDLNNNLLNLVNKYNYDIKDSYLTYYLDNYLDNQVLESFLNLQAEIFEIMEKSKISDSYFKSLYLVKVKYIDLNDLIYFNASLLQDDLDSKSKIFKVIEDSQTSNYQKFIKEKTYQIEIDNLDKKIIFNSEVNFEFLNDILSFLIQEIN